MNLLPTKFESLTEFLMLSLQCSLYDCLHFHAVGHLSCCQGNVQIIQEF